MLEDALKKSNSANLLYVSISNRGEGEDKERLHQEQFPSFIKDLAKKNQNKNYVIILNVYGLKALAPSIILNHRFMFQDGAYIPYDFKNVRFYIVHTYFHSNDSTCNQSEELVLASYIGQKSNNQYTYIADFTVTPPFAGFPLLKQYIKEKNNVMMLDYEGEFVRKLTYDTMYDMLPIYGPKR